MGRNLARLAMAGFALFIVILIAFHFIQPELNPMTRFGSEYAAGELGWLMKLAFFAFAAGLLSLALSLWFGVAAQGRSTVGIILLAVAAIGILGSGLFNADLQGGDRTQTGVLHDLFGFLAFLALIPAMFLVSRRLRRLGPSAGFYRALRVLPWLVLALFLLMMFVFGPVGLVGLGQRLFLIAMFAWLIMVAHGVHVGVFISSRSTGSPER